jgi:hypothetical protein
VFAGEAVDLAGAGAAGDRLELAARHADGSVAMTCEVTLAAGGPADASC